MKQNYLIQKNFFATLLLAIAIFVSGQLVVAPRLVLAQEADKANTGIVPCGNVSSDPCTVAHVFGIGIRMINLLLVFAGIYAIWSILFAAFDMVESSGSEKMAEAGKKHLINAVLGLIIVFIAFILVNSIVYGLLGLKGPNFLDDTKSLLKFIQTPFNSN